MPADSDLDPVPYDALATQLGATVLRDRYLPSLVRGDVRITVEKRFVDNTPYYRFRAELPAPGVPTFRLYPEGFKSFISKAFGGQDVEIGHYDLDLRFMVKARAPELVKQLWKPDLCDRFITLGDVAIEGKDRELRMQQGFDFGSAGAPIAACELLWDLADVDLYGRDVLRALPEAQVRRGLGEVWLPGPNDIRMGFVRTDESVSIKARMRLEHDVALTDDIRRQFELVNAHVDHPDEDVLVVWSDTERSPERLLRGVELMRQLARAPGDGVFR